MTLHIQRNAIKKLLDIIMFLSVSLWFLPKWVKTNIQHFVEEMANKSPLGKVKIATKLYRQFRHPGGKKLNVA